MLPVTKPGTPEEILEHHGTKGMKWGVRRAQTRANVAKANARFNAKNPTSGTKADAIRLARATSNVKFQQATKVKKGTKAEQKAAKTAFLNDPNRAVALRTTRGEKVVGGILVATGVGALPIAALGTAMYVSRKHIEKKQARGGYK